MPPNQILEEINKRPSLDVLKEKEERIWILEKSQNDLQARMSWAEGECILSQKKEKDALQLVRNLSSLIAEPTNLVVRSYLFDAQLVSKGYITRSKIVMILVDCQARMDVVLREMRQLVKRADLNRAMDSSKFSKVPEDLFLRTPVKPMSDPTPSKSGGLGSLLGQTSMLSSDPKPAQPASHEKQVSF